MAGNSYGTIFRVTTFGESHGPAMGVVIDGCPAGLEFDHAMLAKELARRKPGQSAITTSRAEDEAYEVLSGLFEGKTTGAPLTLIIRNKDQRSSDYDALKDVYRPSHADFTWEKKYGLRDHRGGGRSSARETVARVMAGAVAKMFLMKKGIRVQAFVSAVGPLEMSWPYHPLKSVDVESNAVRCPDAEAAKKMIAYIHQLREEGDSTGGVVSCVISGTPVGLGEPVFDKLHAELGKAMLSINACKGFELGSGFEGTKRRGSEHNDAFTAEEDQIKTVTNHSGGIQGGISNGMDIFFRCAFKPVSTIRKTQLTIDQTGASTELSAAGRHDPCVVPRAVPIVEAMAWIILMDMYLRDLSARAIPAKREN
jgi:chorismate synthase